MVKIYKQPFAHDGDTIVIPDASQPDGKISSADGWTVDYQLPSDDPNYKPVDRQEMNGVFKAVTESLGQMQVQGSASWSPAGAPYPINAQVYHNGKQWIALRANSVPPAEGEDWSAVIPQKPVTDALATKADKTTQVIAGTGLTGSGDLTEDRTISIANSHIPLGVGQTWQDMTASRAAGTTYTNTTGRPIQILAQYQDGAIVGGAIFKLGSLTTTTSDIPSGVHPFWFAAVIPNGATYSISGGVSIPTWWELR